MKIKIKKLRGNAVIPHRGTSGAGGVDLYCTEDCTLWKGVPTKLPTGLAFEIPKGHAGFIMTRSSTALKHVHVSNTLIDSDYRGEVFVTATHEGHWEGVGGVNGYVDTYCVKAGDRLAQLYIIPLPEIEFEEVNELSETTRGIGGYGSTGR